MTVLGSTNHSKMPTEESNSRKGRKGNVISTSVLGRQGNQNPQFCFCRSSTDKGTEALDLIREGTEGGCHEAGI